MPGFKISYIGHLMLNSNKSAILIPARAGSKAIKNKNLIKFCGKPLIAWTIEQALKTRFKQDVFITSDSKEVFKIAENYKIKYIDRPKKISGDLSKTEAAIKHFIKKNKTQYKYIILLQPTSPLRYSDDIEKAFDQMIKEKKESLFSASMFSDLTIWKKNKNKFKPLNYDISNRKPRQKDSDYLIENGSIYICSSDNIIKNNNRFKKNSITYYLMNKLQMFEIDEYSDIEICEKIFTNKLY